jgi:eukaryotic-like serine/threonine-protein kinase
VLNAYTLGHDSAELLGSAPLQLVEEVHEKHECSHLYRCCASTPAVDSVENEFDRKLRKATMIGERLLHYQITEKLGEGGMGVVYKARDTHLGRFVAIKLLPFDRVADPARKARFVQEAKAASALNHPNIVHVYDVDCQNGIDFIVMEYIAGKTLEQLISRKGMRLNEALRLAVQVADALACAHSVGIVHRDLKPANILVDGQGQAKVLDFGLAKLSERTSFEDESTASIGVRTEKGAIVGTAPYMSPEQAQARKVDARSDIFSFGAVLYEMITGARAFQGDSILSTLAAVLTKEPKPPGKVVEGLPRELERVIMRCLPKDPEKRHQHMMDVKVLLTNQEKNPSPATWRPLQPRQAPGSDRHGLQAQLSWSWPPPGWDSGSIATAKDRRRGSFRSQPSRVMRPTRGFRRTAAR